MPAFVGVTDYGTLILHNEDVTGAVLNALAARVAVTAMEAARGLFCGLDAQPGIALGKRQRYRYGSFAARRLRVVIGVKHLREFHDVGFSRYRQGFGNDSPTGGD